MKRWAGNVPSRGMAVGTQLVAGTLLIPFIPCGRPAGADAARCRACWRRPCLRGRRLPPLLPPHRGHRRDRRAHRHVPDPGLRRPVGRALPRRNRHTLVLAGAAHCRGNRLRPEKLESGSGPFPFHMPTLFEPLDLGIAVLPNRIIMGSHGLEARPDGMERLAAFYAERAKGGAALIVTGGFSPNDAGNLSAHRAEFSTDEDVKNTRSSRAHGARRGRAHRAAPALRTLLPTSASSHPRPSSRRSIRTPRAKCRARDQPRSTTSRAPPRSPARRATTASK